MVEIERVSLFQDRYGWSVKVKLRRGGTRHYRYGSEAQARYFAAVFGLGPRVLPPVPRARPRRRKRAVAATLPADLTG